MGFAGRDRVVLAFSGGLSSLLTAAIARKQGDVRCVVVGTRGAADVGTAVVARDFLDLRLEVLSPRPPLILETARGLRASDPRLTSAEALDLVPLALVASRHAGQSVLSGFATAPRSAAMADHLTAPGSPSHRGGPWRRVPPPRRLLLRAARELAIPDGFALEARRRPAEGSGIGPAIRGLGHSKHASVERLLDEGV